MEIAPAKSSLEMLTFCLVDRNHLYATGKFLKHIKKTVKDNVIINFWFLLRFRYSLYFLRDPRWRRRWPAGPESRGSKKF